MKSFLKPSLMKFGTWILFAGISNYLLSHIKKLHIIPCKILEINAGWGFCPIDPTLKESTIYFGLNFIDAVYLHFIWPVIIFIGIFIIALPYIASCGCVEGYNYYMRR